MGGKEGMGWNLPATPKCLFLIPNVYFQLPPSQPPNFLRAGTKDPLSVPGVGREERGTLKPVLSEFQAVEGGFKGLLGSPSVSTGPTWAWGPGVGDLGDGAIPVSTVCFTSPKYGFFFLRVPENGELFL